MLPKKSSLPTTRKRLWLASALAVGGCVAVCSAPIFFGVVGAGLAGSLICTPKEALAAVGLSGLAAAILFAVHHRFTSSKCDCTNEASASADGDMPIACDLTVLGQRERTEHVALARSLWKQAKEIIEHQDGFTFVFEQSPLLDERIAQWVSNERKCCPFFSFELASARASLPLKLRISGPDGAKEILAIELKNMNLLA